MILNMILKAHEKYFKKIFAFNLFVLLVLLQTNFKICLLTYASLVIYQFLNEINVNSIISIV